MSGGRSYIPQAASNYAVQSASVLIKNRGRGGQCVGRGGMKKQISFNPIGRRGGTTLRGGGRPGSSGGVPTSVHYRAASQTQSVQPSSGGKNECSFAKFTVTNYVCNICSVQYTKHCSLLNHQVRVHGRERKRGVGRRPKGAAEDTFN